MNPRWTAARRILCVRPDGLAGVLLSTPALRALRQALPERRLTLLAPSSGAAALPFIPELDAAIAHDAAWTGHAPMPPASHVRHVRLAPRDLALASTLAAHRFDAAVIFTATAHSALPAALLCRLAGIPLRLAYGDHNPCGVLSDAMPDSKAAAAPRHEVQRQLALVRHAGVAPTHQRLSFAPRPADMAAARMRLRDAGIDPDGRWLLLHPGAGAPAHRYAAPLWARVLRLLARQPGWPLVLTGGAPEAALVDAIRAAAGMPAVSLAGRLGLGELGAALSLASLAIAGNGAPAQIAAAVGTPLVSLYALTVAQQTPWAVPNRVLYRDVPCRFCAARTCPEGHHACLADVAPERVAAAVVQLLRLRPLPAGWRAIPGGHAVRETAALR
jgi:ADP-heptose:LPS heptosyltransferase